MGDQIVAFKCGDLQTTYSYNQLKGAKGGCENQHCNFHQVTPKHKDIIVINLITLIHHRHMDQAKSKAPSCCEGERETKKGQHYNVPPCVLNQGG